MTEAFTVQAHLREDHQHALLIGRIWQPGVGPVLVKVTADDVLDLSVIAATLTRRKQCANLSGVVPSSEEAIKLKEVLLKQGVWSQYLEVGMGLGDEVGIHPKSVWNNPEPEIVLAVNSRGEVVDATLGNDVNLRDFEGRNALLLSKAKDNNASCAIGPFIRLRDANFSIDDVRCAKLTIRGRYRGLYAQR